MTVPVTKMPLPKVALDKSNRLVCLDWNNDGDADKFPFVWLRDVCQCEECFGSTSKARRILMSNFDVDIEPENVEVS